MSGIILIILTAAVVVLGMIWILYQRQMKDICRQLAFLKEKDSNLLITGQIEFGGMDQLMDELNEWILEQRKERRRYLKKEQEISDIYTNLSHDIRTPLTSLDGYFQLLRDSESKEDRQRYLWIIEERIDSLKELLEELFMYTRLKNEAYEMKKDTVYLNRVLTETVFSYYEEWEKRKIEPEINIEEKQMPIYGNEQGLKRMICNIIKNGLDHGRKKIRISLKEENGQAILSFRNQTDHPEEIDVEKVFERFYKADEARSRNSAGLGLSIAKEFVLRMDGSIRAALEENWFVIEVTFPLSYF